MRSCNDRRSSDSCRSMRRYRERRWAAACRAGRPPAPAEPTSIRSCRRCRSLESSRSRRSSRASSPVRASTSCRPSVPILSEFIGTRTASFSRCKSYGATPTLSGGLDADPAHEQLGQAHLGGVGGIRSRYGAQIVNEMPVLPRLHAIESTRSCLFPRSAGSDASSSTGGYPNGSVGRLPLEELVAGVPVCPLVCPYNQAVLITSGALRFSQVGTKSGRACYASKKISATTTTTTPRKTIIIPSHGTLFMSFAACGVECM